MNGARNRFDVSWTNITLVEQIVAECQEITDHCTVLIDIRFDGLKRDGSIDRRRRRSREAYDEILLLISQIIGVENVQSQRALQIGFHGVHPSARTFETLFEIREHLQSHFRRSNSNR